MHHLFLRARWPALLLAAAVIAACGDRTKLDATETLPVDELYAEGHQALEHGNYERAVKYLRRLVARFPSAATPPRPSWKPRMLSIRRISPKTP